MTDTPARRKLAVFMSFSGTGGVERMVLNLLPEFARSGIDVDLVAILRDPIPQVFRIEEQGVRLTDLGVKHTTLAAPALTCYLRTNRPDAILAAKDRAIRTAVFARALSGRRPRLVGRLGTHLSAALERKSPLARRFRTWPMRWIYRSVDGIVANAEGVAEDTLRLTGLPRDRVEVIRNPVVTPELSGLGAEPVDHPWLQPGQPPVILGAGRLTVQKDFATLIQAFRHVRDRHPCRLVILGAGGLRGDLERLAAALNLDAEVCLAGHVANPYAWMARASVFALSSRWEGSPNVLTEALALGTPSVATDCPSGPREILAGGRYGALVAIGDAAALADAICHTLDDPLPPEELKAAVAGYTVAISARRYLEALRLTEHRS